MMELLSSGGLPSNIGVIIAGMIGVTLLVWAAIYVYTSLTVMYTAKRLGHENPGYAWIPIVGKPIVMAKLAKMHWWPVLLFIGMIIPVINFVAAIVLVVFYYIWWWKITEGRKMPGWIVLLSLIPFLGGIWALVLWGILAWGKD